MAKFSRNLTLFLLLISIAASLIIVGELSGEFGQIRLRSSKPQKLLNISKGEFVSLTNTVSFGFDVGSEEEDVLRVRLATNQTFSWHETIENGKRIFKNENFTLDTTNCSFEIDMTVKSYDEHTLQIIDNTKPKN